MIACGLLQEQIRIAEKLSCNEARMKVAVLTSLIRVFLCALSNVLRGAKRGEAPFDTSLYVRRQYATKLSIGIGFL